MPAQQTNISAVLLKKRLRHRCYPVNFAKFLRTHFFRTPAVAASSAASSFCKVLTIGKARTNLCTKIYHPPMVRIYLGLYREVLYLGWNERYLRAYFETLMTLL